MKYIPVAMAIVLLMTGVVAQADASQIEESFNPLVNLLKGVTRVGWNLMEFFTGFDPVNEAFFAHQLGFQEDVLFQGEINTNVQNCRIGSIKIDNTAETVTCYEQGTTATVTILNDATADPITMEGKTFPQVLADADADENGLLEVEEFFDYAINIAGWEVNVTDDAQGQILLFAFLVPFIMLMYIFWDFFSMTGMFRRNTSLILAVGTTLIAARSGVYVGLLQMIGNVFNNFFISMLSIYLMIAVLFWFINGIVRGAVMTQKQEEVVDAVVQGFTSDMLRGIKVKQAAEELSKKK
ncbi:MAG: hypothetical protein GOU99_03635 [Candidatus Altiarchaeota archaeon]|nr:hypothetical protein [Candidatus Altiarchaeota archaeon]